MVLLSLLGNRGLGQSSEQSTDGAYTVATVEVHKKVGASSSTVPGVLGHTDRKQLTAPLLSCCAGQAEPVHLRLNRRQQQQGRGCWQWLV